MHMGFNVTPRRLATAHERCHGLRRLTAGVGSGGQKSPGQVVADLVRCCSQTQAMDGFLYNATVLALERSLFHRLNLARSLALQLQAPRNRRVDRMEFIRATVACHVEVLIHTATSGQS